MNISLEYNIETEVETIIEAMIIYTLKLKMVILFFNVIMWKRKRVSILSK